ncbi:MAG: glycosyltransferase family 2 protein [Bacteroidales bacterium]|nr:glycosyltransferase family 2 protein [Bacteroidales bacterium]
MDISIIIPIYNVEPYIVECLQSVVKQSFSGSIECVLVDDCGSDGSIKIAEQFIDAYNGPIQFRTIHHSHNKGIGSARNTGLKVAQGEWIFFLDSDDWIYSHCLEELYKLTVKYPDVDFVQGGATCDSSSYRWLNSESWGDYHEYSSDREWIIKQMLSWVGCLPVPVWNKLYRSKFIKKNGLHFKEGIIHEDELWHHYCSYCTSIVAISPINTLHYRYNPNSIISKSNKEKSSKAFHIIIREMIQSLGDDYRDVYINAIYRKIIVCYNDFESRSEQKRAGKQMMLLSMKMVPSHDAFMLFLKGFINYLFDRKIVIFIKQMAHLI